MIHIYNSLTKKKEVFAPITPGEVRMYVCGMTVYDYCHLGHARVMVVFDMVVRYLRARGFKVTYVRNVTDIDDKIIKRAAENNEGVNTLTARFIEAMHEDERALGVLSPDQEPRATEHIAPILAMIGALEKNAYAYRAANHDVYYRVRKFAPYGSLSGKSIDDLRVGARVDVGEEKEDPLDFVLWKAAKPGEPQWDSTWGPGRPGWHIECSAMSTQCLGNNFDIHGGGRDLQFPHHENEIAQSEAATGERFVNTWMHVGFVRVNEEKMSKSLGNFFTVREVLKAFDPEVVRYFILASHYRSPLDYSDDSLVQAKQALSRLYTAMKGVAPGAETDGGDYAQRFNAAMDDDFNTAAAMAVLFDLARDINRLRESDIEEARRCAATLRQLGDVLGILQRDPEEFLRGGAGEGGLRDDQIAALIAQRAAARQAKNWAESDRIRDQLKQAGVVLEDGSGGTTWRRE
ncbi:MAG: cysteine--tRNA ligase [Pseudomonadota bacterium]|nr:MAG: cysteine--tRNA ligase [Pseudomonadota bacterium]